MQEDECRRQGKELANEVECKNRKEVPCVACGYEGPCVQKDDVEIIQQKLLFSDMVVFATPLYYYGMTSRSKYPQEVYQLGRSL